MRRGPRNRGRTHEERVGHAGVVLEASQVRVPTDAAFVRGFEGGLINDKVRLDDAPDGFCGYDSADLPELRLVEPGGVEAAGVLIRRYLEKHRHAHVLGQRASEQLVRPSGSHAA